MQISNSANVVHEFSYLTLQSWVAATTVDAVKEQHYSASLLLRIKLHSSLC